MKNFSLKALGAFIFAAGLVVAGVAAPAQAVGSLSPFSTVSSTTALSNSGANTGTIVLTTTPQTIGTADQIQVQLPNGWSATHGVTSSGLCADLVTSFSQASCSAFIGSGQTYVDLRKTTPFAATTPITVTFPVGSLTQSTGRGFSMIIVAGSNAGTIIDQGSVNFPYTISFDANGGAGSTSAIVTSNMTTALPSNNFTRSGYTFAGWARNAQGTGTIYQPGSTYFVSGDATLFAKWTADPNSSPSNNAATASLALSATTGGLVAGSSVSVSASGLQSTAAYTVTVQSTPQTIGSGNAVSGAVNTNVTLPSGLEAGWHTLTFTSTASDGSAVESKYYFKISASGTLLSTSSTIPAELANTGINTATGISLLAAGLSLALVGAELFMIARRKRSN